MLFVVLLLPAVLILGYSASVPNLTLLWSSELPLSL